MADHAHKQIRDAVATALTGLTTSAARVYANRLYPLGDANLPGLRIYIDDEDAEAQTIHNPMLLERTARLVVECVARANTALDDTVDLMAKEVEIALATAMSVGGKSLQAVYTGSEYEDELGGTPAAARRLKFDLTFYTMNNAPDVFV